MIYLDHRETALTMHEVLDERGVLEAARDHVVSSLVSTSLRGTDSHGINLFPHYCRAVDAGRIEKSPRLKIERTGDATAILDADHAFGHHAGAVAVDLATELAERHGSGIVGVKNSTHFGAAAYFALRAAERDCIGLAFTNADALVKAHSAKEAFFGTNPICFCAPLSTEGPYCLDMATSIVSWNRIKESRRLKNSIEPGWAFDAAGRGVIEADSAASLSPIGEYKGFGLGMMVDILCAVLLGGPIGKDILPMYDSPIEARRRIGHFFMSLDVKRFVEISQFKETLQSMVNRIREMSPSGSEEVMVAGDPEKKTEVERKALGIPIDEGRFEEFLSLSGSFSRARLGG